MTNAARIALGAGWAVVAIAYVAVAIVLLPVLAVASWYAVRPARIEVRR